MTTLRGLVFTGAPVAVTEGAAGVSYTVALGTQPSASVTVTITGQAGTGVALDDASLTFTSVNWATAQAVTVSAAGDADAADESVVLTHTASGGDYGSVTGTVTVNVTDDDSAGLVFTGAPVAVTEGAAGVSYTVALGTQPSASVTVTITGQAGTGVALDDASLVFTSVNWATAQAVTVSAAGDADAADESVVLTHTASGGDYGSVTGTVTVNVTDDDSAGLVFTGAPVAVTEGAAGVSYTVALGTQPSASVTVTITGQAGTSLTLNSARLTFTSVNWATAQAVTVSAAGDADAADESVVLTHTASGGDYGSVTGTVTVNIDDDDTAVSEAVAVTLVQIPNGTVIPDNSSLTADGVGMTVVDGLIWGEGVDVMYRLMFAAVGGGPPAGDGVDVKLSFTWDIDSPLAGLSPNGPNAESWTKEIFVVSAVTSLHRTEVWDTAVQAYDDGVGSPDGKLTIRITDCWRSGCVIGEPSQLTVTILDNDGGPSTSPPGRPDPPRLVCARAGDGYDPTGIAVSWKAPAFKGGADIEGYELRDQRQISSSAYPRTWNNWQARPHFVTATSTTLTGFESGVFYGVQVRAVNANGAGPWSLPNAFMTGLSDDLCEIFDRRTPHP